MCRPNEMCFNFEKMTQNCQSRKRFININLTIKVYGYCSIFPVTGEPKYIKEYIHVYV